MTEPEFSRPLEVSRVPATGCVERIAADARECAALAIRMQVPAIHNFTAELDISPWQGGGLRVTGAVTADLDQISVISLESFRSTVSFPVERYFTRQPASEDSEADSIVNGMIDLGEIAAETFGLELDPYPRRSDENFAGFESTGEPQAKVSPFAVLAKKTQRRE